MRGLVAEADSPLSLLGQLPGIYVEDDLACRLVAAFDDVLAPVFLALDNLPAYLDPALAPTDFLRWLGRWVAAVDDPELPDDRRRALVAGAMALHARRGTAGGVAALVELVTGVAPVIDESGGTAWSTRPGTDPPGGSRSGVVVRVPAEVDQRIVQIVLDGACPAHLPHRIETRTPSGGGPE
ncbi:MAG: phage tail protein [Pseudonocardiaceae bacterium]|nr:phage tail protein [Pseudonocardiaceae bacterium]